VIDLSMCRIQAFRRKVWRFYARYGRSLPFRRTTDPYKITVAEFMLQQTQVERVVPKYKAWIKQWPTWKSLADATPRQLLTAWSGLGYNRRALYLGKLACVVCERFDGILPDDPDQLRTLPGIGAYTANAVLIFAHNRPLVTIDTNVRRVILNEFGLPGSTAKADLEKIACRLMPRGRSRDWHNALMDYSRIALPKRLTHIPPVTVQPAFKGSQRETRGVIVKSLTGANRVSLDKMSRLLERPLLDVRKAAESLQKDGIIRMGKRFVTLA
jgi:A/G-specific adenine glycosylase